MGDGDGRCLKLNPDKQAFNLRRFPKFGCPAFETGKPGIFFLFGALLKICRKREQLQKLYCLGHF